MTEAQKPASNNPEFRITEADLVEHGAGFDIDAALNKKGFLEFLAEHPDTESFDMDDAGEMKKRFEVFEIKDGVSKGLEKIYSSHIQDQIDIKLEAGDAKSVKDYIDKLAIEDPEKVHELNEKLKTFVEVPKEIQGLEAELTKLGNTNSYAKETGEALHLKKDLEAVIPTIGSLKYKAKYALALLSFAPLRDWKGFEDVGYVEAAKNKFNEDYGEQKNPGKGEKIADRKKLYSVLMETSQKIEEIEAALDKIKTTEELKTILKTSFDAARRDIIGGMAEIKGLTEAVNKRSCAELEKMMKPGTLDALQKSQERLESLQFAAYNPDLGIRPLAVGDAGIFQDQINEMVEKNIPQQIWKIVYDTDLGSNALTKFEKALDPFLKADKLGSKEDDEARAFIRGIIENIVSEEPQPPAQKPEHPEGKVKRLIMRRILAKLAKS